MADNFLSQDEVDALLKGVTGETDDAPADADRPLGCAAVQPRHAGTHRARAHAHARDHQRALCAPAPYRPVQLPAARHRSLGRPGQGLEIQRIHPQPGGADQPQPDPDQAAARHRADDFQSRPGVSDGRQPVRRRRTLPYAGRRAGLHPDRTPHHPARAEYRVRGLFEILGADLPGRIRVRALGNEHPVRQHRHPERSGGVHHLRHRTRPGQRRNAYLHALLDDRADQGPARPAACRPKTWKWTNAGFA